jgi:hypothetical protein
MIRSVEEKYVYTYTNMRIMCTLRPGTGACRWAWGGGLLNMRICGTLLMEAQETLRNYLCLIFFYYTAGTYSDVFGAHNSADFFPRRPNKSDCFSRHVCDTHKGAFILGCLV